MRRMIVGLMALALAAPVVRAEDKPAKPEGARAEEDYKALQKGFRAAEAKFQAKRKELIQALQKATTQKEKQDIVKKYQALAKDAGLDKFAPRFLAFAEKNPKSPDAYDALLQTLKLTGPQDKSGQWSKAMGLFLKDQVESENMAKLARMLGGLQDDATLKLLKAIVEKNPNRKAQAYACKALAKSPDKEADKYGKLLKDKYADVFPDLSVGKKAPEVVSQDVGGKKVKLSAYKGKVVVLDIWATWCPPCRAMIPHERELVKRLKDKPFALISISADAKKEDLTKFLGETPMPWVHWWNGEQGGIVEDWEVRGFPTIYVLDAKGVIRYKNVRGKDMDEAVETLLKEMGVKVEPAKEEKESSKDKKDSAK